MAISEFAVGAIHSSNKLVQDHFKASNVFVISVRRDTAGWLLVVPFVAGSGAHGRLFFAFSCPSSPLRATRIPQRQDHLHYPAVA